MTHDAILVPYKGHRNGVAVRLNLWRMTTRLGALLRLDRAVNGTSVREQATDIGLTKTTLQRIEHADPMTLSVDTMLKVLSWLSSPAPQTRGERGV